MDSTNEDRATRFATEILRKHPQISFDHAVAAAEYSGVSALPRPVFYQAVKRLGIARDEEELSTPPPRAPATGASAGLIERLDGLQGKFKETTAMRAALVDIRKVVRAALATDG